MPDVESLLEEFSVKARSPAENKLVSLKVDPQRVRELASSGRNNDIFALVYNVCGMLPPVNNVGYHERSIPFVDNWGGLRHTHVIFKGLKRPFHDDNHDSEIYMYVVAPRFVYKYVPDMTCVARRVEAPKNTVFVAYVKFGDEFFTSGSVINWEWVVSDNRSPNKPKDFLNRYDQQVWENE
jgi:hypothetical protein